MKVYAYKNCDTCRKAQKHLSAKGVEFELLAIRDTPPSAAELKTMLKAYDGELKRLFNTSGQDYRKLNIKDKLADMSDAQAIELLASNGNLIKRPFVLDGKTGVVGFKADEWKERLNL